MPVLQANTRGTGTVCPKDQATLMAVLRDKDLWHKAYKVCVLPNAAKRLELLEGIGAEQGAEVRSLVSERARQMMANRKAGARALADAASARYQSFDYLTAGDAA